MAAGLSLLVMASGENEKAEDASSSSSIEFRHFDSVPLALDHHFINSEASDNMSNNVKIMKEWRILEHNLPDSIYVQVYETRIDLLRAVIIGSAGTPYQDGLFFFDIYLPPDYPNQPPQVYCRSHGYHLNPNLYKDGRLCLSLIDTWIGGKEERWTDTSTLLQLLVSLQGLVLNSRPFFNEPLFHYFQGSKFFMWINVSNSYNEDAFILSCKTMKKIVEHPPQNFERFVKEHFRQRAASILAAIDQYQQGFVPVGQLGMTLASSSSSDQVRISSKTKSNLERIRGHLELAFAPFVPVVPRRARAATPTTTTAAAAAEEKRENGLFNVIASFLKKIFNLDTEEC